MCTNSHLSGVAGQTIVHASNIDVLVHPLQTTRLGAERDLVLRGVASRLERVDASVPARY